MDLININDTDTFLLVSESNNELSFEQTLKNISKKRFVNPQNISDLEKSTYTAVLVEVAENEITTNLVRHLFRALKPGARVTISKIAKNTDDVIFVLKTNGFTNVQLQDTNIISVKPKYEIGSSAKLNLQKSTAVWKIDDNLDEAETLDPDEMLDDDDLRKPDPSTLRVCGSTGKRKACRDCSCGLAEELAKEAKSGQVIDTSQAPRSSCGSCYLGDAFRCATCPYLGMPAFKPGEKIQLTDNLLKADI